MRQATLDDIWGDDEEDEDALKDRYLTFHLGDEDYGLEIRHVTEIISIQKITDVPDLPDFVKGVINLRGQVIPTLDLRLRFGLPAKDYDERTCVIITRMNDIPVGIIVDTVNEVMNIPSETISPPPSVQKGAAHRFVEGLGRVGDSVKILLNAEKLLHGDELELLEASQA
ncbi:MAG: chemotaxis protein CheW [Planctomycetota bacterium]|jgi:purine-binding chemotaxis protein CheW|nr:chemotaxis protein CheW [Planctomycetota bacterium]